MAQLVFQIISSCITAIFVEFAKYLLHKYRKNRKK